MLQRPEFILNRCVGVVGDGALVLSQRDRAAGWLVMAKSGKLELRENIYLTL